MIQYKEFEIDDVGELTLMMKDFYAIDNYPINLEISSMLFKQFIENASLGKGWKIVYNEVTAGYVILTYVFSFEFAGRIIFLDELYVKPEFQGNGIGSATVDFVKSQKENLEGEIMYLEVEPHNSKAQELYQKKGFTRHKRSLMILK